MAICMITGTLRKADESLAVGHQVIATIQSTQDDLGGQVAGGAGIVSDPIEAFTGEDGTFSIDVVQGALVLLEIPSINLRKIIAVPSTNTVDFVTLI